VWSVFVLVGLERRCRVECRCVPRKCEAKATVVVVGVVSKRGSKTVLGKRCRWVSVVEHCGWRCIASLSSKAPHVACVLLSWRWI
jgi:hypothetical protein